MLLAAAVRPVRARPVRAAAGLRAAHRRRVRTSSGVVVTMAAALPARPAHLADRAGPGAARRHRPARDVAAHAGCVLGSRWSSSAAVLGSVSGCSSTVPLAGWFVGRGILAILLGVARGQPGHQPAVPARSRGRRTPRLFGTVGNLAGQNSLRNPRRTTATASALMIGLALACTMAIVGDSAKASVDKSVEDNFVGDYIVSNVFGGEFNAAIADEMAAVDGVEQVVRERYQFARRSTATTTAARRRDPDAGRRPASSTSPAASATDRRRARSWWRSRTPRTEELGGRRRRRVRRCPPGEQEWEVVGVFEDNPVIFFAGADDARRRWRTPASSRPTTR